jgi:hypothetical protein
MRNIILIILILLSNNALTQSPSTPVVATSLTMLNAQWTIGHIPAIDLTGKIKPFPLKPDFTSGIFVAAGDGNPIGCYQVNKIKLNITGFSPSKILAANGAASCSVNSNGQDPINAPLPIVGTIIIDSDQYLMSLYIGNGFLRCSLDKSSANSKVEPDLNTIMSVNNAASTLGDYKCTYLGLLKDYRIYMRFDGFVN